jgi:predicted secreted protein
MWAAIFEIVVWLMFFAMVLALVFLLVRTLDDDRLRAAPHTSQAARAHRRPGRRGAPTRRRRPHA